jgi:hypothetical protein
MDYTKNDLEDSEKEKPCRRITLKYMGAVKAEILKDFIIRGIKAEKLKSMMVARSRLERLKLWAVRATAVVLLWAIAIQLTAIGRTLGPTAFNRHRIAYSLPPESK